MTFKNIVFMQDSEAVEVLELIRRDGEEKAIEYLLQWDFGDDYEEEEVESIGQYVPQKLTRYWHGNLLLSYHHRLGIVGLAEVWEHHDGERIVCFDNFGETQDQYTVVYLDRPKTKSGLYECLSIGKGIREHSSCQLGPHLGSYIMKEFLPKNSL